MNKIPHTRQFQTDYILSWDFNEPDLPCVNIVKIERDGAHVVGTVIGALNEKSGCVSLRQVIEDFERGERENAKRKVSRSELLKKFVAKKKEDSTDAT